VNVDIHGYTGCIVLYRDSNSSVGRIYGSRPEISMFVGCLDTVYVACTTEITLYSLTRVLLFIHSINSCHYTYSDCCQV
jgi:hypothetical protein